MIATKQLDLVFVMQMLKDKIVTLVLLNIMSFLNVMVSSETLLANKHKTFVCHLFQACDCDPEGALSNNCDKEHGTCDCMENVVGDNCDVCRHAYYGFPICHPCNCNSLGSVDDTCENGVCACSSETIAGEKCDHCAEEHYDFPSCKSCECSTEGSRDTDCNSVSGDCDCIENVTGRTCDQCIEDYYGFPNCTGIKYNSSRSKGLNIDIKIVSECGCNGVGTTNVTSCDSEGVCSCKIGYTGDKCDECEPGYYSEDGETCLGKNINSV